MPCFYHGTNRVYPRQPDLKDVTIKALKALQVLELDSPFEPPVRKPENNRVVYSFKLLRKTGKADRFRLKVLDLACYNLRIRYLEW